MALRPIRTLGEEVLKRKAKEVEKVDAYIVQLLNDMAQTMYENKGIGLAANQIGVLKRVVVVDIGDGLIKLVNPRITKKEGAEVCTEACLSVPGLYGDVERYTTIVVKASDEHQKSVDVEATGLLARCLQHEIDHLNGRLFIDIATNIREGADEEEPEEPGAEAVDAQEEQQPSSCSNSPI
jgi:peptide deformylase